MGIPDDAALLGENLYNVLYVVWPRPVHVLPVGCTEHVSITAVEKVDHRNATHTNAQVSRLAARPDLLCTLLPIVNGVLVCGKYVKSSAYSTQQGFTCIRRCVAWRTSRWRENVFQMVPLGGWGNTD